jgi:alpha-beta hydrolase superfamily lysophospholipase
MGSGEDSKMTLAMGRFALNINTMIYGERHKSKLIQALSLGRYNTKFFGEHSSRSWISANVDNQIQSENDIYCSFMFSNKAYKALRNVLSYISDPKHIGGISPDLPVLFLSGSDDPVGGFKKGVNIAADKMKNNGVRDITVKFYDGLRHELIKEDGKETVFRDLYEWIECIG